MNSQQQHQHNARLRDLGLVQTASNGVNESASDDEKRALELVEMKNEGDRLDRKVDQLIEQLLALQTQVQECQDTKRFLSTALDAADDLDLIRCAIATNDAIAQQRKTMQRAAGCESALIRLRDEAEPSERIEIDRFLTRVGAASRIVRPALSTEIDL